MKRQLEHKFVYGNRLIAFKEENMHVDYVDNLKDLEDWEKKLNDFAIYLVELIKDNVIIGYKYALVTYPQTIRRINEI